MIPYEFKTFRGIFDASGERYYSTETEDYWKPIADDFLNQLGKEGWEIIDTARKNGKLMEVLMKRFEMNLGPSGY